MEEKLADVHLRHSILICLHVQMAQYLNCLSRGYLGENTPKEKALADKLDGIVLDIVDVLKYYYEREREIMEP